MWDKNMNDANLIELAHKLASRARPSSSSDRLQTEPSQAGSFTTEPILNRAFFELFSSEFQTSCEPRVFWTPVLNGEKSKESHLMKGWINTIQFLRKMFGHLDQTGQKVKISPFDNIG